MKHHSPNPDAQDLEAAFFAKENQRLLERLREKEDREARRVALREVAPLASEALLDHFLDLNIGPETVLAVVLMPLVMVAWADGEISPREREAILRAAEERGVEQATPAHEVLESWLSHKPGTKLVEAWKRYVGSLGTSFSDDERRDMRQVMVGLARGVAEAAGGFLGLGTKISAAEREILEEVAQAFA